MPLIIKTHGEYYFKTETGKGRKQFIQELKAPGLEFFRQTSVKSTGTDEDGKLTFRETSFINVRGIIKKRLLPAILQRKYTDFARVREVTIDEVLSDDGTPLPLPITLRSRSQLAQYIEQKEYPIDPESYLSIDELRSDILACEESVDNFLVGKARRDRMRADEKAFLEMNGLADAPIVAPTPKPQPPTQKQTPTKPVKPGIADAL